MACIGQRVIEIQLRVFFGTVGGSRTLKGLRPLVFETNAYTIPPPRHCFAIHEILLQLGNVWKLCKKKSFKPIME